MSQPFSELILRGKEFRNDRFAETYRRSVNAAFQSENHFGLELVNHALATLDDN